MVQPETRADAEVEIVDERDENQGKAATNETVGSTTANTTVNSARCAAAEKDAIMRRLGELHHPLNSRKGSLNAKYKKNTEATDKVHDLNQNCIQAPDALAVEYKAFEITMTNVTSEHEAGDVSHAAALEVADEPERTQKDQGRLQDDLDCSCDDLAAATKDFSDCWAAHGSHGRQIMQCLQGSLQPTCNSRGNLCGSKKGAAQQRARQSGRSRQRWNRFSGTSRTSSRQSHALLDVRRAGS